MNMPIAFRRKILETLQAEPGQMTVQIARRLGVPEAEVVRLLPAEQATELDAERRRELVESFEELGDVHVLVSNAAATLECTGRFGGFSEWGEFFNVQTSTLDMHLRLDQVGSAFAVRRPMGRPGAEILGFLFFDRDGTSAFKVYLAFGGKPASEAATQAFEARKVRFAAVRSSDSH